MNCPQNRLSIADYDRLSTTYRSATVVVANTKAHRSDTICRHLHRLPSCKYQDKQMPEGTMHTFIDLGAFNGDTIDLAIRHLPRIDMIYGFEPLATHCETMKERFEDRGSSWAQNTVISPVRFTRATRIVLRNRSSSIPSISLVSYVRNSARILNLAPSR